MVNDIKYGKMDNLHKFGVFILDALSGGTFFYGFITGQELFMIVGGAASLMAFCNHGYDFIKKITKKK